ncbi:MAG: ABC transporter permease [Actinomycetota bacterium]|nr:ABC transporter permease [Actinomycetota bacterium]
MTTAVATATRPANDESRLDALRWAVADSLAVAWRNVTAMRRVPEVVVFSTIQPVIFVIMFRYVFGGAIQVPGVPYVDFLMPGIFIQTVTFGAVNTAVGLGEDLHQGLIERFRSLPMARSAVLAGRTLADLARNVLVVTIMVTVGFLVGFRVHTNAAAFAAAIALVLLFSFAMSWVFAVVGLSAPNAEAAQASSFPIMALLVFASSAFVPTDTMPGWLQAYADHQPVSITVNAVRALVLGGPTASYVLQAIAWAVGIIAVFAPLAIARYRRVA